MSPGGVLNDFLDGNPNIYTQMGGGIYGFATDSNQRGQAWNSLVSEFKHTFTDVDAFSQRVGRGGAVNLLTLGASRFSNAVGFLKKTTTSVGNSLSQGPLLRSSEINFSQRSVSSSVVQYTDDMVNGAWDWTRSGPLRVMEREGVWVSYDNRRLMAAQQAGITVPAQIVQPNEIRRPGVTWGQAFRARFADPRNVSTGGIVPNSGLSTQPIVIPRR